MIALAEKLQEEEDVMPLSSFNTAVTSSFAGNDVPVPLLFS